MRGGAFAAVVLVAACGKSGETSPAPSRSAPAKVTASEAPKSKCVIAPVPLRRSAPGRVVAIGDLHGDLAATKAALRAAGAIDASDDWSGGNLTIVQTGDALDRGDGEREIVDLLAALGEQAHAAGGELIQLLGNHELMNAAGDFRYVTRGGFRDFAAPPAIDTSHVPTDVADAARARVAAVMPGGDYAKRFAGHDVVAIVGDTVYSHAGVLPAWASRVDEVNTSARCWLDGQAGGANDQPAVLTADDSPVWTRAYGMGDVDCAQLTNALATLGAKRMVVGHTVQDHGINSVCDGALWRIDVGMTAMFGGPIQVLEFPAAGPPKVLVGAR
jgi:hypothetical protein